MTLFQRVITAIKPIKIAPAPVVETKTQRRFVPPASVQGRSLFDAAGSGRLLADWTTTNSTSDKELRQSIDSLRARSRQMAFNDPYLKKFIRILENNVIGPAGILLGAKSKYPDGSLDKLDNTRIEAAWYEWAKRGNCDTSKTYSLVDIQKQIIRAVAMDGEIFIRKLNGYNNKHKFALRLYEADWLATYKNENLSNGNTVRMGIELNPDDEPVGYYFYKNNPADDPLNTMNRSELLRIPADQIIHVYYRDRVSQHRGVPWGMCSLINLRHINKYIESEVVAARVAAAQMGFLTTPTGTEYKGDTSQDGYAEMEVEPGMFKQLPEGWKMEQFNPQHPTTQFQQFVKSMVRGVAVGFGVGYSNLSSDREGVTYSSLRQEAIEEQDNWKTLQSWFIDNAMERIYSSWLDMALGYVLPLPAIKKYKYLEVIWYPRRWSWVDPQKDIAATLLSLENKLTSRTKILSDQGLDFEEVIQEIAAEEELMKKYGIEPAPKKEPAQPPQEKDDEQEQSKQAIQ